MRIGGSVVDKYHDPEEFAAIAKRANYRAVTFPSGDEILEEEAKRYQKALADADITIAEVGAWQNNPIGGTEKERKEAVGRIQRRLALADEVDARCCVNIAGGRASIWDGPHMENFSEDTFALIVDSVREIIDGVKPKRTFYTVEPMPYMLPCGPESYLRLIKAVDRPSFAVHLDIINMINCPERFYDNKEFTRDCFRQLGAYIKSIHIKDIQIHSQLTLHLQECLVGKGQYDFPTFFSCASELDPDMPVLVEHMSSQKEFDDSVAYLQKYL